MVWTDERMDDLTDRMDDGFTRVDGDIRELRSEVKETREQMHAGFKDLRTEMHYGLEKVHTEVAELRSMMFRFGITMFARMFGLIATLMAAIVTGSFAS